MCVCNTCDGEMIVAFLFSKEGKNHSCKKRCQKCLEVYHDAILEDELDRDLRHPDSLDSTVNGQKWQMMGLLKEVKTLAEIR